MRRLFIFLIVISLAVILPCGLIAAAPSAKTAAGARMPADEAQRLYQAYGDAVYQVQVIDLASGKKSSIGSGFQFTKDGLIATNYHVVAEAVQHSGSNRVEYLHDKGEKGTLTVLTADVVHDVAIVRMDKPGRTWLKLGTSKLAKGVRLFSLGNPHDIGFTIVEGTYNGLSKESFTDQIHFSGAINPGMSGGPAIGHDGAVAGINVATAGNQIGFLVPVEALKNLQEKYRKRPKGYDFIKQADRLIEQQLLADQDAKIGALMKRKWESVPFGPVMVPGHIHDVLKCWGGSAHKDKDPYLSYFSMCSSQDRMFLAEDFDTGLVYYQYNYITGKPALLLPRFYNFYQGQFSFPAGDWKNAKEDDVTNFDCNSSFVDLAGFRWKANFCVRQYKKYPAIYDMHLAMALVGEGKTGFAATLTAQGLSMQNALALSSRFMQEIKHGKPGAASAPEKGPT